MVTLSQVNEARFSRSLSCVLKKKKISQLRQCNNSVIPKSVVDEREKLELVYGWIFLFNTENRCKGRSKQRCQISVTHFTASLMCFVTIITKNNANFLLLVKYTMANSSISLLFILFLCLYSSSVGMQNMVIFKEITTYFQSTTHYFIFTQTSSFGYVR